MRMWRACASAKRTRGGPHRCSQPVELSTFSIGLSYHSTLCVLSGMYRRRLMPSAARGCYDTVLHWHTRYLLTVY